MTAVSDSGPLIHLSWLDLLQLLPSLFGEVAVPTAVRDEVLRDDPNLPGIAALRDAFTEDWLRVRPVSSTAAQPVTLSGLGAGESEALALMRVLATDVLLMDERRGRRYASDEGLPVMGTIGVLRLARDHSLIPAVTPLLNQLRANGFRVSTEIIEQIQLEESPRP